MFRDWIAAAAASFSLYTGMNAWHELPTRQAAVIRKSQTEALQRAPREFADAFKAAAD